MKYIRKNIDFFFMAALGALIISTVIYFNVSNDFGAHRSILEHKLNDDSFPVPPLYYALLYILSFGLASGKIIFLAIVFLAGMFIGLKYLVTRYMVGQIALPGANTPGIELFGKFKTDTIIRVLTFCLMIVTPLSFGKYLYLGKIGINVWHNSTIIAEFPFALMLFMCSGRYLQKRESIRPFNLLLLTCMVILIKPSYFLAFAVAFPLMNLAINYADMKRIKIDLPVILTVFSGLLLLTLLYVKIYGPIVPNTVLATSQGSKLIIAPFRAWQIYSQNIPFDLLMSIFYPFTFLVAYWREVKKDLGYLYAVLTFCIGVLIAIFFFESGLRDFHGNYFWTAIITNYILFLYSASLNLRLVLIRSRFLLKDYLLLGVFGAHLISGLFYIVNLYMRKSF